MNKLKVVWLCHFSNNEVQDRIKPKRRIGEYAPWIPSLIKTLENHEEIELHVIAPHEYITGVKSFTLKGIHYYFFNAHMPITGRHWPRFFKWDYISNFRHNKLIVKRLVNSIHPDVIHLHGAENAYFASAILQFFDKYPIIFTLQGFISSAPIKRSYVFKKRVRIEKEIISKIKYAFYRTETMKEQMGSINPNIKFFWNDYPAIKINPIEGVKKIYDLVYFARITKDKGIGDLIKALSILKKNRESISLCVIGGGSLKSWKKLANELGVSDNITWAGFLPTQNDVHKLASKSKISVLPTYHDIISGTIIESLFLKLPVVAYNVGSIHEVNKHDEIISLVNKWDIEGLANAIEYLLEHPEIQSLRAEKGYIRAREMFIHSESEIRNSLITAYKDIVSDF